MLTALATTSLGITLPTASAPGRSDQSSLQSPLISAVVALGSSTRVFLDLEIPISYYRPTAGRLHGGLLAAVGARIAITEQLGLELSSSYGTPVNHRHARGDYMMLMSALSYESKPTQVVYDAQAPGVLSAEAGIGLDVRDFYHGGRLSLGLRASDRFSLHAIARVSVSQKSHSWSQRELGLGLRTRFLSTQRGAPHVDLEILTVRTPGSLEEGIGSGAGVRVGVGYTRWLTPRFGVGGAASLALGTVANQEVVPYAFGQMEAFTVVRL